MLYQHITVWGAWAASGVCRGLSWHIPRGSCPLMIGDFMPCFHRALRFQPFEEHFAVIWFWLNSCLKNKSILPPPTLPGSRSHCLATHGWFELILLQFAAETAEDFRELLGQRSEQSTKSILLVPSFICSCFCRGINSLSYISINCSFCSSFSDAAVMSPPFHTEKAAAINQVAKPRELQVGSRHCSAWIAAIQVKLLCSSQGLVFFFLYYYHHIMLWNSIFCIFFSSAWILDLCE